MYTFHTLNKYVYYRHDDVDDDDKGKLKSLGMTMVAGPTRFMPLFQPLEP